MGISRVIFSATSTSDIANIEACFSACQSRKLASPIEFLLSFVWYLFFPPINFVGPRPSFLDRGSQSAPALLPARYLPYMPWFICRFFMFNICIGWWDEHENTSTPSLIESRPTGHCLFSGGRYSYFSKFTLPRSFCSV